jgi:hypothetical protein
MWDMNNSRRIWARSGLVLVPLLVSSLLSWDRYSRTVCLTEDGVTFLRYARQLGGEGPRPDPATLVGQRGPAARHVLDCFADCCPALSVLEVNDQHPGYPLLILALRRSVGDWLADDPLGRWSRSAQLVSLLAGLVLTLGVYLLGRRLLGPAAGFAAAVVVAVSPAFVAQRAEALSDAAALACLVLSAWLALRTLATNRCRDAALCGLCGGIGYLIRPEAVQVAALLALVLAARGLMGAPARRRQFMQLAALTLPLLCCCGPYMAVRGSVLTKSGSVLVGVNAAADPLLASPGERAGGWGRFPGAERLPAPDSPAGKLVRGAKRFLSGWVRGLGVALAVPVVLGLWLARQRFARHPGHRLILAVVAVNAVLLPGVLFYHKGYMDGRHVLPVAALTACWAWPGLRALGRALRPRLALSLRSAAALVLTVLALGELPACWSATFHGERYGHRRAGEWLAAQAVPGPLVYDLSGLATLYAGWEDRTIRPPRTGAVTRGYLEALARCCQALGYVVISDRNLDEDGSAAATGGGRLREVASFPASVDPRCPYRVRIFSVQRDGSRP